MRIRERNVFTALVFAVLLCSSAATTQAQVTLQVIPNATTFDSGNTLRILLTAFYRGPAFTADFYFGVIHPDGINATFITNLNPLTAVVRPLTQPQSFPALYPAITIPANFTSSLPSFFVYQLTSAEAPGTYTFFAALSPIGAFADGVVADTDFIGLAQRAITIVPPTTIDCGRGVRC